MNTNRLAKPVPSPCPVGYCRAEAGHTTPHDIAPCLRTCGPLRPGKGRVHDPSCRNANFYEVKAHSTERAPVAGDARTYP